MSFAPISADFGPSLGSIGAGTTDKFGDVWPKFDVGVGPIRNGFDLIRAAALEWVLWASSRGTARDGRRGDFEDCVRTPRVGVTKDLGRMPDPNSPVRISTIIGATGALRCSGATCRGSERIRPTCLAGGPHTSGPFYRPPPLHSGPEMAHAPKDRPRFEHVRPWRWCTLDLHSGWYRVNAGVFDDLGPWPVLALLRTCYTAPPLAVLRCSVHGRCAGSHRQRAWCCVGCRGSRDRHPLSGFGSQSAKHVRFRPSWAQIRSEIGEVLPKLFGHRQIQRGMCQCWPAFGQVQIWPTPARDQPKLVRIRVGLA